MHCAINNAPRTAECTPVGWDEKRIVVANADREGAIQAIMVATTLRKSRANSGEPIAGPPNRQRLDAIRSAVAMELPNGMRTGSMTDRLTRHRRSG
jgi:hypothetical protein